MEKKWIVYRHTSPSGKVYIGITTNIKGRWASQGRKYCTYNSIFKKAIKKYGWDNIQHEILLEGISKSEAIYSEKYLIKWYKLHDISYNITDGGEGTLGMKFTQERIQHAVEAKYANQSVDYLVIDKDFNYTVFQTIKEVAEYLGGIHSNISHILRQPIGYTFKKHYIWKHQKGSPINISDIKDQILDALAVRHQKLSEQAKSNSEKLCSASKAATARMSIEERKAKYGHGEKLKGRHHSDETRQKMSNAAKGRDMSKAIAASLKVKHKVVTRPIVQIDLNNNIINTFPSITAANISLGKTSNSITNCLQGRAATAFGYKWKYKSIGGN